MLAFAALPAAAATATVTLLEPERFTDVGTDRQHARSHEYLEAIDDHIRQRASSWLPAGDRLEVRITDVDMAGDFEPWRRPMRDVRVLRGIYPPRIVLAFRWTAADGVVRGEGERVLEDRAYLTQTRAYSRGDPTRFEKALLDRWMRREFVKR